MLLHYPENGPQRYSLVTMVGSILTNLTAGVAYKGIPGLSIGADVQLITGRFKAETVLSGCDAAICAFPEDPEYDALATLDLMPVIALSGAFGFTYDVGPFRIGGSATLPWKVKGDADLKVQLPTAWLLEDASVSGDKASLEMKFPWIFRGGVELRSEDESFRGEVAVVYEQWSVQEELRIVPKNVRIDGLGGIGSYEVGPTIIPRNMKDTWSVRAGYEWALPISFSDGDSDVTTRGGLGYETSAFPTSTLTPLTMDSDKWLISSGLSLRFTETFRMEGILSYMYMPKQKVRDSIVKQSTTIRPESTTATIIGNGDYDMHAWTLGGALVFLLE
jgi:long-chain fatty acid transport protein